MAKVILICGKICSGKTTYAGELKKKEGAVVLSSDELMLSLFDPLLGDKHDELAKRANDYLLGLALKLIEADVSVILDWGFWTKAGREDVSRFFRGHGIETEWHYVRISDEAWRRNIDKRNREVEEGKAQAYYVDEGLLKKLESRFEAPEAGEMDIEFAAEC